MIRKGNVAELGKLRIQGEKKAVKAEAPVGRSMVEGGVKLNSDWPFYPQEMEPTAVKQVRMHQEVVLPVVVLEDEENLSDVIDVD